MCDQSCFSNKELNCVNVVLNLPGFVFVGCFCSFTVSLPNLTLGREKKSSKEEFLASNIVCGIISHYTVSASPSFSRSHDYYVLL